MLDTLYEFLLSPYRDAQLLDIVLEVLAAVLGVVSVICAKRENILVYPTGIISTAIYVYLLFKFTLFGDMVVNIYYTLMSIYGWYVWSRSAAYTNQLKVSKTNSRDKKIAGIIFVSTALFVVIIYLLNNRFDRWTDYVDTFTTGIFFTAMWLMAHKKLESWIFWIIGNVISIPLYLYKGLGFTSIQYIIFLVLAFSGYIAWKTSYNKRSIANS